MTQRGNPNQFLRRIKGSSNWYVSVRVPRLLEKTLGTTHIRKSLGTGDLKRANALKHPVVARIKADLAEIARNHSRGEPIERGLTRAAAEVIREGIEYARANDNEATESEMRHKAVAQAHEIAALYGDAAAHRFIRRATNTEPRLDALADKWLAASDYKEVTKDAHREALRGLLAFLPHDDAGPTDVSRLVASDYIDAGLATRGLAQKTIRRKLNSLSAFWDWLEVKGQAPAGANPWRGHKISAKTHKGTRPPVRVYTDEELVALLRGPSSGRGRPTTKTVRDLSILGLFTGARIEELCTLRGSDVEKRAGAYILRVRDAKTKAGIRPLAIVHAAPRAVIARRVKAATVGKLFPELKPGGIDGKLSHEASKAFGRYRRACGVSDGPNFHSFRRQVATVLERADVPPLRVDRFLGHKTGRLATDVYSAGSSEAQALDTAKRIRHAPEVEAAALAASKAT